LVDLLALAALARTYRAGDGGFARIRVRAAPLRARSDLLAGDGGGLADQAAAGTAHQVHVDVIAVIDVRARRQHRGEMDARAGLHVAQKALLFRHAAPAVLHGDAAAVGEHEGGDVERVAE